ncbi:MAG: acyl-CoA thioesterase [Clostridiales bacterium]|nr:acyl-CoA thioesterase [Clostridiales bacterium]
MGIMDKVKVYEHKAQYYETDQMGCVHHSNYIRWFEEARTELLEQVGFSYKRMEEEGIMSPVLSVTAEYKSMVRYQDVVEIAIKVTSFNGIKFTMEYVVRDKETQVIRTTGRSEHCLLNLECKPIRLMKVNKPIYDLFMELSEAGWTSKDI